MSSSAAGVLNEVGGNGFSEVRTPEVAPLSAGLTTAPVTTGVVGPPIAANIISTPIDEYDTAVYQDLVDKYKEAYPLVATICEVKASHPDNISAREFSIKYFDSLPDDQKADFIRVIASGAENADSGVGVYAMQPSDYERFKPFMSRVLRDYHKVGLTTKHVNDWSLKGVAGLPESGKLDLNDLGVGELSMRVRVGRNLADFPLPGAMTKEDRINMENKMCGAFGVLQNTFGGRYYSLTEGHTDFIDATTYNELVKAHFMFKDMADDCYLASAGIASDWPTGRGCYISADQQFIIWVGEEDHLRIMCMKKGAVLNEIFDRLKSALDTVESIEGLKFAQSPDYGYVTSCPTNMGTGMRASVHIKVPNLTSDGTEAKAKAICKPLGLSVRGLGGEHTAIGADGTIDLSPSARFAIKESEIIVALYKGISQLKTAEDQAGQVQQWERIIEGR